MRSARNEWMRLNALSAVRGNCPPAERGQSEDISRDFSCPPNGSPTQLRAAFPCYAAERREACSPAARQRRGSMSGGVPPFIHLAGAGSAGGPAYGGSSAAVGS
jgi:hypothetical protein